MEGEKEELHKTVDAISEQKHQVEVDIDKLKNTEQLMTNLEEMLESNIQEFRKRKADLDEEINHLQLERNEARSELEKSQKDLKDLHCAFLRAISLYKKKLNLNIKFEEDDRIQVEFTDILTSEKKPCHFRLKLVDSKWILVDIEPFFPDSKKFAQQMEATQDMQEFLVCVRKQLKLVANGKKS
ncbi:hypothetical protein C0J52_06428 [Blattella germanica]|nr:hypothetical protein C0J52_06428 [Blattella germanica]